MERTIQFRAKKKDSGNMVYGYYVGVLGYETIIDAGGKPSEIERSTLAQYTGLKDKKSNSIFELDFATLDGEMGQIRYDGGEFDWVNLSTGVEKPLITVSGDLVVVAEPEKPFREPVFPIFQELNRLNKMKCEIEADIALLESKLQ